MDAKCGVTFNAGDGTVWEDGTIVVEGREGLLHGEECAAHIEATGLVEVIFGNLFKRCELAEAGTGKQNIDMALFTLDGFMRSFKTSSVSLLEKPNRLRSCALIELIISRSHGARLPAIRMRHHSAEDMLAPRAVNANSFQQSSDRSHDFVSCRAGPLRNLSRHGELC